VKERDCWPNADTIGLVQLVLWGKAVEKQKWLKKDSNDRKTITTIDFQPLKSA
jgi:hypothetical protein